MKEKLLNRKNQINIIFTLIFFILAARLAVLTIAQGDAYLEKSLNNRLKKIPQIAKRGEIYDRNGKLLAGNEPAFAVSLMGSNLSKNEVSEVAIKIFDMLDLKEEKHLEFPIKYENGQYYYSYDKNITDWLERNGYPDYYDAQAILDDVRTKEQIAEELSNQEAYSIILSKGTTLPFSINKMEYWEKLQKNNFLKYYGLELDTPAEEAFNTIRSRKDFKISEDYSVEDTYKILILKNALKEKGYLKYEPIKIASNISKESAVLLSEMSIDLPGISVDVEPVRTYVYNDTASHILGYMGKISSENEIEKYVKEYKYNKNQLIGKVGLEGSLELDLHGKNGYKYIEVDALGKQVNEVNENIEGIEAEKVKSGKDVKLTIDVDLQIKLEQHLEDVITSIRTSSTYESPWGDYKYNKGNKNTKSGAAIAVNVKNGEVLAMASYPDYDLNLFSTGISYDDWDKLTPENPKDPLSPRPLYNLTTLTAVQPGSTYKMMVGYAAVEEGLNPYDKLYSDGEIAIGNHEWGCWYWNSYGGKHGYTDLFKAIEVSCNYYFYDIASGKDYYKGTSLSHSLGVEKMLEYSKDFGFNDQTGIEIEESSKGIPDPNKKKNTLKLYLEFRLKDIISEYFPKEMINSEEKVNNIISTIISWSDENPTRGSMIRRLSELGCTDSEKLADIVKYDYFNSMQWKEGDTLNLAIGQGEHKYTPAQIARYIMAIANDGYLYELSLVKQIGDEVVDKTQGVTRLQMNNEDSLAYVRKGMLQVTSGSSGTAKGVFSGFPVKVGGKTGTAEKQGKIPPKDEIAYFKKYLRYIDSSLTFEDVEIKTNEILKERNQEIARLKLQLNENLSEEENNKITKRVNKLLSSKYLNEENAMREAIKKLSRKKITDNMINEHRENYDDFAWFVSFAPYDDPEIAVVVMIPQGSHGGWAAPVARDVIADYLNLVPPVKKVKVSEGLELNSN